MFEQDFDDSVARGLRRYIRQVGQALGLRGECWCVQADETASAYIPLDGRLKRFPGHDVALVWDENHGWSAGIETQGCHDLLLVAHLGGDVRPPAETVATWVRSVYTGDIERGSLAASTSIPFTLPSRSR